jgi:hypothetical protein
MSLPEAYFNALPVGMPVLDKTYSLEPDMVFGWKPTTNRPLPLPLRFSHSMTDTIVSTIASGRFPHWRLIYLGPRFLDTLDIHQHYSGTNTYPCIICVCIYVV